ncbi:hypothetical protein ACLQ2N_36015, partial [Streptomyces sp. DT224]|uniref:hypothetical protein n=1 Tax=Streptomyces sp. DT224 TaxID=3393426 RepID=UPI003CEF8061
MATVASSPQAPAAAIDQGVKAAFADWLRFRDVSVPEKLGAAAEDAFSRWLWGNSKTVSYVGVGSLSSSWVGVRGVGLF